ncbi:hypothetical protein SAMN05444391_0132 [Thermocrinis minervae]|uniref:PelD GGDEF domain-containing protein n=1 Tax=Thermocrinis minervae TaxID=381751 RepID=A0A1M6Q970_9AQUI|nr:hypothetical protein SAMN05444391_0132 [Thermocrinis minervae]
MIKHILNFIDSAVFYSAVLFLLYTTFKQDFVNIKPNLYLLFYTFLILYKGLPSAVSGVVVYSFFYYYIFGNLPLTSLLYEYLTFGLVSVFFHFLFSNRLNYQKERADLLADKLNEVLREFYILKVSYEQVAKKYVLHMPLRDILQSISKDILNSSTVNRRDYLFDRLRDILFDEFSVKSFAIYDAEQNLLFKTEKYEEIDDVLLNEVFNRLKTVPSIVKAADVKVEKEGFLAAIPVIRDKDLEMVLVIQRMDFKAYNLENLQLIAIVLSYIYHMFIEDKYVYFTECTPDFNGSIKAAMELMKSLGIKSYLVYIENKGLTKEVFEDIYEYISRRTRTLDKICIDKDKIMVLLFLTELAGTERYIEKIRSDIEKNFVPQVLEHLSFKIVPLTFVEEKSYAVSG